MTTETKEVATEVIVDFYGDPIIAVQDGSEVYVSIRRVCDAMELAFSAQLQKLKSKPWSTVSMIDTVASDNIVREQSVINLKALPMWLATIDSNRVAPELRSKLERYQTECHDVLANYFFSPTKTMATRSGRRVQVDHTGTVIGNWTITGPTDTQRWHIQCDCGHEQTALLANVKVGCRCHACGASSRHSVKRNSTRATTPVADTINEWPAKLRKAADAIETLLSLNLREIPSLDSLLS